MQPARPLRDVLTDLVGEADAAGPADVLAANGHADLPDELVAEAVGSFADTSPIEVAEHLAPYVMSDSPVPQPDAPPVDLASWLDVVTTAPPPADVDPTALLDDGDDDGDDGGALHEPAHQPAAVEVGDLAFGHGHAATPPADHHVSTMDSFEDPSGDDPTFGHADAPFDSDTPDPAALDHFPHPDFHHPDFHHPDFTHPDFHHPAADDDAADDADDTPDA